MTEGIFDKNRTRAAPLFANINLLGKCNADCFFCLGKDLPEQFNKHNQLRVHFGRWANFKDFIQALHGNNIKRVYITGQNCDSLQYQYLGPLIDYLHKDGFGVGLRTNGYLALKKMNIINKCDLSVGYTINSLAYDTTWWPGYTSKTNWLIMGIKKIPNWKRILKETTNPRVQIVINRHNGRQFLKIVKYVSEFPNVKYIQARRISTDTRQEYLLPDIEEYERVYSLIANEFKQIGEFYTAEIYDIYGKNVCFWRTVKTTVNSFNYFTDGTISKEYFIIEGYLKAKGLMK